MHELRSPLGSLSIAWCSVDEAQQDSIESNERRNKFQRNWSTRTTTAPREKLDQTMNRARERAGTTHGCCCTHQDTRRAQMMSPRPIVMAVTVVSSSRTRAFLDGALSIAYSLARGIKVAEASKFGHRSSEVISDVLSTLQFSWHRAFGT